MKKKILEEPRKIENPAVIHIYLRKSGDSSGKRALEWMIMHNLSYDSKLIKKMSESDLRLILKLSEGFSELLRPQKQAIYKDINHSIDFDESTTEELIDYILQHPLVLRTPLIFTDKKLLIGYNVVEIRKFLPKSYRRVDYMQRTQL